LKVSGSFPAWLHGDYIRNGPGTFKGMDHMFDGYGMLVKFSFENGKVTTQQRFAYKALFRLSVPSLAGKPVGVSCHITSFVLHCACSLVL